MDHLKKHVTACDEDKSQCRYCLKSFANEDALEAHVTTAHPIQTKNGPGSYRCIICSVSTSTQFTQKNRGEYSKMIRLTFQYFTDRISIDTVAQQSHAKGSHTC